MNNLIELRDALREFAKERDWDQFHSPKNLAMALAGETGELIEKFQWMSEEASQQLSNDLRQHVSDEVADVLIYLVRRADKCDIDLMDAATSKLEKTRIKFPAEKVRGSAKKYSDYK